MTLENIEISFPGHGNDGLAVVPLSRLKDVPEEEAGYPEFSMFGELPSWGFSAVRHGRINDENVTVKERGKDFRPAFVFDDVDTLMLGGIFVSAANGGAPVVLRAVRGEEIRKVVVAGYGGRVVRVVE